MAEPEFVARLEGVTRTYRRAGVPIEALRGVDLRVEPGELVVLLGRSGCGKSTLLHLLGGIDRVDSGAINVAGVDLAAASERDLDRFRQRHVGMMLQSDNLLANATALDQVALQLLARGASWRSARRDAAANLARFGLADRLRHRPAELSGGEQQRVALARALAGEPSLVLADEPTGELDEATTAAVISLIQRQHQESSCTFVIATHDPLLTEVATRVVRLRDGRVED